MVFNVVFNSISVTSRRPVHLSMLSWSSFNQYSAQYPLQTTGCLPTYSLSKQRTAVRERGMNPVAMTIIDPRKEYWPSRGSNQRLPVLKSTTLPIELWGSASISETGMVCKCKISTGHHVINEIMEDTTLNTTSFSYKPTNEGGNERWR